MSFLNIPWEIINYNICAFLNIEEQLHLIITCKKNYNNIEMNLSSLDKHDDFMINKSYILIQLNKNKITGYDYNIKVNYLKIKKYMTFDNYFICYYRKYKGNINIYKFKGSYYRKSFYLYAYGDNILFYEKVGDEMEIINTDTCYVNGIEYAYASSFWLRQKEEKDDIQDIINPIYSYTCG